MRVYWIRHGQMEFRAHRLEEFETINALFNQETESSLSDRGRAEARAVARHFGDVRVDVIYASPLLRAKETADATAEALGLDVNVRHEMSELRTGRLPEGSRAHRILTGIHSSPIPKPARRLLLGAALVPIYFRSWLAGETEGGESPADLEARLTSLFDQLHATHEKDAHVALFAHGFVIHYLSRTLAEPGLRTWHPRMQPYIANGSITTMEIAPGRRPRLIRYAHKGHL